MKYLILTFLLIALTVVSVSVSLAQGGKKADAPNTQAPEKGEDTWERQKECLRAAEADIARQPKRVTVFAWQDGQRITACGTGICYVKLELWLVVDTAEDAKPNIIYSAQLRDALENALVAGYASQPYMGETKVRLCHIPGKEEVPCEQAKAFIEEHMTN